MTMSDDETVRDEPNRDISRESTATNSPSESRDHERTGRRSKRIYLVPYPKFVFMYPTLVIATIATIVLYFGGYRAVDPDADKLPVVMTGLFLFVMMANMFVLVFDFPRATSLTLIFIAISFALGLWTLTVIKPELLPSIGNLISKIRPVANSSFFCCISIAMVVMYIAIFAKVRFDYWELSSNELLHHHGFLSDLKRYPAPNLRVDKEINDVFEYMLLGAGRLILHPSTEKRAIVLDNILFVSKKERELTKELSSLKVTIGGDSGEE
jgi:hypothetical protein